MTAGVSGRRAVRRLNPASLIRSGSAAVFAADVAGLSVALLRRRAAVRETLLKGTPLNPPVPFVAVQAALLAAGTRARPHAQRVATFALAATGAVSIASGFFDGGYAAEGYDLSLAERGIQAAIVGATAVTTVAAVTHAAGGTFASEH